MKGVSVLSERLTEKTKDCFGYRLKDGSDSEVGFFKDYDAFYSHMMTVRALGEYEDLEEQGLLLRLQFKKGQKVYYIDKSCIDGSLFIASIIYSYSCLDFPREYFGTKSEAEEKLRELEGKNG